MSIQISQQRFKDVMSAFYTLTGICVTVFDIHHNILAYYPEYNCPLCEIMQSFEKTRCKCFESDLQSFVKCKQANGPIFHRCHAGLTEATFPLKQGKQLYGYLMFGQILSSPKDEPAKDNIRRLCLENGIDNIDYVVEMFDTVEVKTESEIKAAAVLFNACVSYLLSNDVILFRNGVILGDAIEYIEKNLHSDLSTEVICKNINTTRTKLYQIFADELGMGVSTYVRECRLKKAKELLKTTNDSISDIALSVGFSDYNYFTRVFKKQFGMSPYAYRQQ